MSQDTYWLIRISPTREMFAYRDWTALGGLDPYGQHQLVWKLFNLPPHQPDQRTPFLFRAEITDGLPHFYVLSKALPKDASGKWRIEPREYRPALAIGDRLAFKLRANPVVERAGGAVLNGEGKPLVRPSGAHAGENKLKVTRHDIVMDAKQRMGWKDIAPERRPSLAQVAYEAGSLWLHAREDRLGCRFDSECLRVEGHTTHCIKGRRDERGRCRGITLSTMDFEGFLTITDADSFAQALLTGIGPAKGFGCGLMMVRRA